MDFSISTPIVNVPNYGVPINSPNYGVPINSPNYGVPINSIVEEYRVPNFNTTSILNPDTLIFAFTPSEMSSKTKKVRITTIFKGR